MVGWNARRRADPAGVYRGYIQHYRPGPWCPVTSTDMPVRTALDALTMRPTRFLRSSWPWRSMLYLVTGAVLGSPLMFLLFAGSFDGPVLAAGVVATVVMPLCGVAVARLERW